MYEYYSTIKKREILSFSGWMELENIMLSKVSRVDEEVCMLPLPCGRQIQLQKQAS
jgi:hypothetical protein